MKEKKNNINGVDRGVSSI